jgi:hypothetical protein
MGAPQGAGHCRGNAHLEQKLYEQELQVHSPIFSWIVLERPKFP